MKIHEIKSFLDDKAFKYESPSFINEDPIQISNDILKGCDLSKTTVILDRKEAITSAINELRENSVLLVLGKGHEMYQEIDNSHIPFNDNDFINKTIGGLI